MILLIAICCACLFLCTGGIILPGGKMPHTGNNLLPKSNDDIPLDVTIECLFNSILLTFKTSQNFSGRVSVMGAKKYSCRCFRSYENVGAEFSFRVPLTNCNTRSKSLEEGGVPQVFNNTVVVIPDTEMPFKENMTIPVECSYPKNMRKLNSELKRNPKVPQHFIDNFVLMSSVNMLVYDLEPLQTNTEVVIEKGLIAMWVPDQDIYRFHVQDCHVSNEKMLRHNLIGDGCSVSPVMSDFMYNDNRTTAAGFTNPNVLRSIYPDSKILFFFCSVKLCFGSLDVCVKDESLCDDDSILYKMNLKQKKDKIPVKVSNSSFTHYTYFKYEVSERRMQPVDEDYKKLAILGFPVPHKKPQRVINRAPRIESNLKRKFETTLKPKHETKRDHKPDVTTVDENVVKTLLVKKPDEEDTTNYIGVIGFCLFFLFLVIFIYSLAR